MMPWRPNVWQPFTKMLTNCFWLNRPRYRWPLVHAFSWRCGLAASPRCRWCHLSNSEPLKCHRGSSGHHPNSHWLLITSERGSGKEKELEAFAFTIVYMYIDAHIHIYVCVCVFIYIYVCMGLQLYLWDFNNQPPKCLLRLCVCKRLGGLLLSWQKLKEQDAFLGLCLWCAVPQTSHPLWVGGRVCRAGGALLRPREHQLQFSALCLKVSSVPDCSAW